MILLEFVDCCCTFFSSSCWVNYSYSYIKLATGLLFFIRPGRSQISSEASMFSITWPISVNQVMMASPVFKYLPFVLFWTYHGNFKSFCTGIFLFFLPAILTYSCPDYCLFIGFLFLFLFDMSLWVRNRVEATHNF